MQNILRILLPLLLACLLSSCSTTRAERPFTRTEITADLDEFIRIVSSIHPQLDYSANAGELRSAAATIKERVPEHANIREAWRLLAELNPLFHDAHTGLQYPAEAFESHRKSGGIVFPLPIYVDDNAALRVAESVDYPPGIVAHSEILAINGIQTKRILADAMPLMRGESDGVKRLVLEYNFAAYLWTLYGPRRSYSVVTRGAGGLTRRVHLPKSSVPARATQGPNVFYYEPLQSDTGYVEIRSFDPALKQEFDAFLARTFASIHSAGLRRLIIDIRRNAGGAHQLSDSLLAYITRKPVRAASALTARLHESNRDVAPDRALGEVVTIDFQEWLSPANPEHLFDGEIFLLVGQR